MLGNCLDVDQGTHDASSWFCVVSHSVKPLLYVQYIFHHSLHIVHKMNS